MAAGLSDTAHDMEWIVSLIDARASKPGPRGPYKSGKLERQSEMLPTVAENRNSGQHRVIEAFHPVDAEEMPNDRSRI